MRRRHHGTLQEQIQAGEQSVSRTSDSLDFRLITVWPGEGLKSIARLQHKASASFIQAQHGALSLITSQATSWAQARRCFPDVDAPNAAFLCPSCPFSLHGNQKRRRNKGGRVVWKGDPYSQHERRLYLNAWRSWEMINEMSFPQNRRPFPMTTAIDSRISHQSTLQTFDGVCIYKCSHLMLSDRRSVMNL